LEKKVYRMGHNLFRRLTTPVLIDVDSMSAGYELRSESGRIIRLNGVVKGRAITGRYVMMAPDGVTVVHREHGQLELPQGVYEVDHVRDDMPQELRSRTDIFSEDTATALSPKELD
jgi:hypothetical protein